MATPQTSYTVYLVSYVSMRKSHHAIYVDIEKGVRGHVLHVKGSIQQGMGFEARDSKHPLSGATAEWLRPLGRASQDKFAQIEDVCKTVPVPAKQLEKNKFLVPKDQIRHSQHWTADATEAMQNTNVLEPLGEHESTHVIYRR